MKTDPVPGFPERLGDLLRVPPGGLRRLRYAECEYEVSPPSALADPKPDQWTVTAIWFTVEHAGVFANGRQQSRIHVEIEVKDGGTPVRLTETEKASIHLIRYDDETPLTIDEADFHEGWSSQKAYRGYRFQAPGRETASAGDARSGEIFEFYVSAGPGEAGSLRRLGFSFRGDNGWTYRSNGWHTTNGGIREYLSHMDIRSGNAVTALPPPTYQSAQVELHGQRTMMPIDNQAVTLSLFDAGRPVGIRRMTCVPAGAIHWYRNSGASPCFTGHAEAGDTAYRWNPDVPKGFQPLPSPATVKEPTIIVCARNDIPREDHTDPPQGPLLVQLVDDFGTTLQCRVAFDPEARERLSVS